MHGISERARQATYYDSIEKLNAPFYIRWTKGPNYETAFLCIEDGEPDMLCFAEVSFKDAILFKVGLELASKNV